MAFTYVKLMDPMVVPTGTAGVILANLAGQKTFVSDIDLHNTTTSAIAVTLYLVPDSSGSLGTAGASNQVYNLLLPGSESVIIELRYPYVLADTNDAIFALAGSAGVNIVIRGGKDL